MRVRWLVAIALVLLVLNCALISDNGLVEAKKKKKKSSEASSVKAQDDDEIDSVLKKKLQDADDDDKPAKADKDVTEKDSDKKKKAKKDDKQDDEDRTALLAKKAKKAKARAKKQEKAETRLATKLASARKRNTKMAAQRKAKKAAIQKSRSKAREKLDKLAKQKAEADTPAARKAGLAKLAWMVKQSARSTGNIISMDDEQFKQYVNDGPRPYWTMLSLTALAPAQQCQICQIAHAETIPLAQTHEAKREIPAGEAVFSLAEEAMPVFFVEVDVVRARDLFGRLGLNSAPTIAMVPPRIGEKKSSVTSFFAGLKNKFRFSAMSQSMSGDDFAGFINKLRSAAPAVSVEKGINHQQLVLYAVLLVCAILIVYFFGPQLLRLRGFHTLWIVGAFCVYLFGVSGGMYNVIRETPFSRYKEDGTEYYISSSGREQYGLEGYLMGGCNVLVAVFIVWGARGAMKDPEADKPVDKRSALAPVKAVLGTFFSPAVCFGVAALCWYQILSIYTYKNGHYNMGLLLRANFRD